MKPYLTPWACARPLLLMAGFGYGLAQHRSALWVGVALAALAEGLWWGTTIRTSKGRPIHPWLVIVIGLGAWVVGPLRSGAWLLVLSAEWLVRPALWDGGIISHGRARRAGRKARKLRDLAAHARSDGDGVTLAAVAAATETAGRTEPRPVAMTFVQGVISKMSDGTERWEDMPV